MSALPRLSDASSNGHVPKGEGDNFDQQTGYAYKGVDYIIVDSYRRLGMSRLRYIRENVLDMTQEELAVALGISQPSVSALERTDRFHHHMPRIRDLAIERGVDWQDALFFDPLPHISEPEAQVA